MFTLKQGVILFLFGSFISYFPLSVYNYNKHLQSSFLLQEAVSNRKGFKAVTRYGDGFIAAGTDGQIGWISASGTVTRSEKIPGERFNCILSDGLIVIAAGDKGALFISSEQAAFRRINSNTDANINSLAIFRGKILGGSDHGEIISGDLKGTFKTTKLSLRGNVVSVSARESECFGVTDEGEIIHTLDGIKWNITDFNKVYSGYYKTCNFTKIIVTENRIAIIGKHADGSPVLMLSTQGNVWTERTLIYSDDQGFKTILGDSLNDILYDESGDMFYVVCNKGKVMQLPSCNQCNKVLEIAAENLTGISFNENTLVIVGENFIVKAVSLKW